jgi:siroheme synthase-like protein
MPFGYVISLDLDDHLAVVVGGGVVAASRAVDLRDAGARVRVVADEVSDALADVVAAEQADHGPAAVELRERPYRHGDLDGATLAIATREEPLDVEAFWAESRERHVLTAVLDDLDHADFAAPALVRSGSLRIAVATAGRAPALAKRLRVHLEQTFGDTAGELVDALAEARARAGARDVDFATWAARWEEALADLDGLLDEVRAGHRDQLVDRTVAIITGRAHRRAQEVTPR